MEIQDCLVSLDLQDYQDSRELLVARVQQEVVETLVELVSRDLLVLPAHKAKLELLDRTDSLDQTEQLASLDLQVLAGGLLVLTSFIYIFIIFESPAVLFLGSVPLFPNTDNVQCSESFVQLCKTL